MDDNTAQDNNDTLELTLDTVVELESDALSDEQRTFLEENKDSLDDGQREKFGIEASVNYDELEIETRTIKETDEKPTDPADPVDPEDGDVDLDDLKAIKKIISKETQPIAQQQQKQVQRLQGVVDTAEVNEYLRQQPELEKYRKSILKHMSHPSYSDIPVRHIAAMVSAKDQQKIGAIKEREATKKADDTKNLGTGARKPTGDAKNWGTAPVEEFNAQRAEVLGHPDS